MSIPPPIVVTCTHARTTELSARVRVQLCRSLSYTRQLAEDMQQCSLAFARDKKLGDLLIYTRQLSCLGVRTRCQCRLQNQQQVKNAQLVTIV